MSNVNFVQISKAGELVLMSERALSFASLMKTEQE